MAQAGGGSSLRELLLPALLCVPPIPPCVPNSSVCPQLLCASPTPLRAPNSSVCPQLVCATRLVGCRQPLGQWPGRNLCPVLLCSAVPCPVQGHTGTGPRGSSGAGAKGRKATVLLPPVASKRSQGACLPGALSHCVSPACCWHLSTPGDFPRGLSPSPLLPLPLGTAVALALCHSPGNCVSTIVPGACVSAGRDVRASAHGGGGTVLEPASPASSLASAAPGVPGSGNAGLRERAQCLRGRAGGSEGLAWSRVCW